MCQYTLHVKYDLQCVKQYVKADSPGYIYRENKIRKTNKHLIYDCFETSKPLCFNHMDIAETNKQTTKLKL